MPVLRVAAISLSLSGIWSSAFAEGFLLQGDVGHQYAQVRKELIKDGSSPIDEVQNPNRTCDGEDEACFMYDELFDCAIDRETPCRFE